MTTSNNPGGNLLDGKFDEGESHGSFLEALKAFRGEPSTAAEEQPKSVRFQGDAAEKSGAKKNFFANLDNNDFQVNCLPEPPTFTDGGTKPDASIADPKYGPKDSCWQCYKLYPRESAIPCKISNKKFCKSICL